MQIADNDLMKLSAEAKETKQPEMDLLRRRYPALSGHDLDWAAMRMQTLAKTAAQTAPQMAGAPVQASA